MSHRGPGFVTFAPFTQGRYCGPGFASPGDDPAAKHRRWRRLARGQYRRVPAASTADVVGQRLAGEALQGAAQRNMGGGPVGAAPPPDAAEPNIKPRDEDELRALHQAALKQLLADGDEVPSSDTEEGSSALLPVR